MRSAASPRTRFVLRRPASLLMAVLIACACATPDAQRAEVRSEGGFRISKEVSVSASARRDFASATQRLGQQDYDGAIELLLAVAEAAPDATTVHINLGIAYGRVGTLELATASLERALQLDPRHPVALNEIGIVYRRTGRFEQARASYEKALASYPDFHFARRNLAILCDLYLGDTKCALEHYVSYSKAAPGDEAIPMWIRDLRNRVGE